MRGLHPSLLALGLGGCIWISDGDVDNRFVELTDRDNDGYQDAAHGGDDCDDSDATVHPGAIEICNGVDDDCSGTVDDELLEPWYPDEDGDGFGNEGGMSVTCDPQEGWVDNGDDCDDGDDEVNPDADELCNGVDDDCDDEVDEDDAEDAETWYLDSDGDDYGDVASFAIACEAPDGYVADATDCDDEDAAIHPGADELCDGVDNDCDDEEDEDDAVDAATWYADEDEDGYGDEDETTIACEQPDGYVSDDTDCDDDDEAAYPGGLEILDDDADGDCDGEADGFVFSLHDTRSASDIEGPRLALGDGQLYLAWAAEELDDGGTVFDAVAVSVFDDTDLAKGETDFWSEGESADDAQLNRFDFVANDSTWVAGSSWVDISSRSIRLDAVDSGSLAHGSYTSHSSWPMSFDQVQLGMSSLGNVTAVGCGESGAGIQALQISAAGIVTGTVAPAADDEARGALDDHDVCEYDHVGYSFYMGSSSQRSLDYYAFDFDSDEIYSFQTATSQYQLSDFEFSSAHGFLALAFSDLDGGNGIFLQVMDMVTEDAVAESGYTPDPLQHLDVSPSPTGVTYACGVDDRGAAFLLWSDLLNAVSPAIDSLELEAEDLGSIEDCAITVTADSVALIALRSGDDVAIGTIQVP